LQKIGKKLLGMMLTGGMMKRPTGLARHGTPQMMAGVKGLGMTGTLLMDGGLTSQRHPGLCHRLVLMLRWPPTQLEANLVEMFKLLTPMPLQLKPTKRCLKPARLLHKLELPVDTTTPAA
jgi:hypothetical protein